MKSIICLISNYCRIEIYIFFYLVETVGANINRPNSRLPSRNINPFERAAHDGLGSAVVSNHHIAIGANIDPHKAR